MKELQAELVKLLDLFVANERFRESPVPGVRCMKVSQTERRTKRHWHSCLGIVAQGCKEILLGCETYRCADAHFTATPIDLPVISRIAAASAEKPFLCLLIDLDPLALSEIAAQFERDFSKEKNECPQAMFVGKANEQMLAAAVRLVKLFDSPEDAPILGPLLMKEIFYHLLKSPSGSALHQFVRSGSKMQKVSQSIHELRSELSHELDVGVLAKAANMSRSAFFKHFKEVTAVSPIQYQKRLRLLEARRLMTEGGETAERSAFSVGYKSASQFSREYSRLFGTSPLQHAAQLRKRGATVSPNQLK
jgi:AraC-like DNA-binding protein